MKNVFCFTLKALSVFKILNFCSDFFDHAKNGWVRNLRLISNFLTSQTKKQIIGIYVLPNMSRSKSNQTLKFGELIEHNRKTFFFEKSCTKCDGETTLRPFLKKSKLSISLDQQAKVSYIFSCMSNSRTTKRYWN